MTSLKTSALLLHLAGCTAILVANLTQAIAAPPSDLTPNPVLSEWFKSLKQPDTSLPCCSISDCRRVDYRITGDGAYEVRIEGAWYKVPDNIILRQKGNPVGRAVACYTTIFGYTTLPGAPHGDRIEILCFVPELPTS
jgi:hypothetical protein